METVSPNMNLGTTLSASIKFLRDFDSKPKVIIPEERHGLIERSGDFEERFTVITDGRDVAEQFTLDRNGFSFHQFKTEMEDFLDDTQVREVYYPEVQLFIKSIAGAKKVHVFDHTVRIEDESKRNLQSVRAPVEVAHNDYTEKSGPQRVRDLFEKEEAEDWLQQRYAVINVWRSINEPVITKPLALSDASTMQSGDFIATDLVYADRTGEILQVKYSAKQRWYYFSDMTCDEALLIKCFDSAIDGRARFTAHTAFTNPNAQENKPPRESIEVRTLVAF
tara:strand:- start:2195 stop:3031 length:837 start_codon:yes stop_codon:yes gene_type:complete